ETPLGRGVKATVSPGGVVEPPPRATPSKTAAVATAAAAPPSPSPSRTRLRRLARRSAAIRRAMRSPRCAGGAGAGASRSGSAREIRAATGARASASARHLGHPSMWASVLARSSGSSCPSTSAPIRSRQGRHSSAVISHLLEGVSERPQSVVDAALDRSLGNAELRRHLRVRATPQVRLHQDPPMLLPDPSQRLLDLPVQEDVLERLMPPVGHLAADPGPSGASAPEVDDHVAEDREQPR